MKRPRRLLIHAAVIVGMLAGTFAVVSPASASATDCHGPTETSMVCLYLNGSSNHVNYTATYVSAYPGRDLCNRRAWNSGMNLNDTNYWSRTSSIQTGCVRGHGEVYLNYNSKVGHPSWFYAQYYTNGQWLAGQPKVLVRI